MSRLGILGATALSISLAVAAPALAQHMRGGGVGHVSGGNFGAMRAGGATFGGAQANFRGAQASLGGANVAGRPGGAQITQGSFRDGGFRRDRDHDRGFGAGAGFVAGLAAGSAFGYDYGYVDPYYGDDYAYYDGDYYDPGYSVVVGQNVGVDASYCAQRYRSYDPATGTYLGLDGLRHPCP